MDLGIRGRRAIVCAASQGLGRACAESLAREGCDLIINARTPGPLEEAAEAMRRAFGVSVTAVAADINSEAGRDALLAACPNPDILVSSPGTRQVPGDFRSWDRAEDAKILEAASAAVRLYNPRPFRAEDMQTPVEADREVRSKRKASPDAVILVSDSDKAPAADPHAPAQSSRHMPKNHIARIGRSNAGVYTKAPDAGGAKAETEHEREARHKNLKARGGLSYKRADISLMLRQLKIHCS
jgi:NAD(P)-dependent dehydrogenase (short-subunit alcohol dehydrogenase family)